MKFSEKVLQECDKTFIQEITPAMELAVSNHEIVYCTDLVDFGRGVIPGMLVMIMPIEDESLYDVIEPILEKYSSVESDTDYPTSSLTILPEQVTKLEVFCQK